MSQVLVIGGETEIGRSVGKRLAVAGIPLDFASSGADALSRLRMRSFGVVVTCSNSAVDEDLVLLEEMRSIRPGVKCIVLAPESTTEDLIAAMRAKVFACFTPPFDARDIADLAMRAASDDQWRDDIQVLSAKPGWVTLRVNCRLLTAERFMTFARELATRMPDEARDELLNGLREIVLNAMEHGAAFNPDQVIEVAGIQTARSLVFYVRDPGAGFRQESLDHAAIANPASDPVAHILRREAEGMRPGGFGLLFARGAVDELIYNEIGNQVLLIKYLASDPEPERG
jgi:anti-sigma regulatory factor (Ser/Thr protein kinase)/ActR/RegA family two-component response regulator